MSEHVALWTVFVWPALTGILNVVLRSKSPEQWVTLGETHPRVAGFIRLFRAIGLDPAKAVSGIVEVATGKRPV